MDPRIAGTTRRLRRRPRNVRDGSEFYGADGGTFGAARAGRMERGGRRIGRRASSRNGGGRRGARFRAESAQPWRIWPKAGDGCGSGRARPNAR